MACGWRAVRLQKRENEHRREQPDENRESASRGFLEATRSSATSWLQGELNVTLLTIEMVSDEIAAVLEIPAMLPSLHLISDLMDQFQTRLMGLISYALTRRPVNQRRSVGVGAEVCIA